MQNPPFFYVVSFHFLVQDKNNELIHQNWRKEFHNTNPLVAREEAFNEYEEYLEFLNTNQKLDKDLYGNIIITSPMGIPERPELEKTDEIEITKDLVAFSKAYSEYQQFSEDLDLLIVITDEKLVEEIGFGDSTLAIHSVSSHSVNKQGLIDNLTSEIELYKRTKIATINNTVIVEHYGDDYYESGEEDESVEYSILPTPFIWTTKEQYENEEAKEDGDEESSELNNKLSWRKIIESGETNTLELKSSLAYNFSESLANWKPLFNNAKTIAGFLNSNGGVLVIGVKDDGTLAGIEKDHELLGNKDRIRLKVDDLMSTYFSNTVASLIEVFFETIEGKELLVIAVKPSKTPIFLKMYNSRNNVYSKHFFVRRSASTTEMKDVEEMVIYIINHWYYSN